jgi:hypothetical protein
MQTLQAPSDTFGLGRQPDEGCERIPAPARPVDLRVQRFHPALDSAAHVSGGGRAENTLAPRRADVPFELPCELADDEDSDLVLVELDATAEALKIILYSLSLFLEGLIP